MNENDQITELEDRLVDCALHESLGGETPPDLSERILAAANIPPATRSATDVSVTRRRRWTMFAVAASLFVAAGFTVLSRPNDDVRNTQVASTNQKSLEPNQRTAQQSPTPNADQQWYIERALGNPEPQRNVLVRDGKFPQRDSRVLDEALHPELAGEPLAETESAALGELSEATEGRDASGRATRFRFDAAPGAKPSSDSSGPLFLAESSGFIRESAVKEKAASIGLTPQLDRFSEPLDGDRKFATQVPASVPIDRGAPGFEWQDRLRQSQGPLQSVTDGRGPGNSGDQYTRIYENPFVEARLDKAVSTFSIDVDTASYANVRQFLLQSGQLPPPDAVRIEELVNYFDYDYSGPTGDVPFAAHVEVAGCPWQPEHRLVRVGIKGREIERTKRPPSNLVFLVDVSGSMNEPNKLPLLIEGMKQFTRQLGENDRVAIVVYASSEGLALPSTRGDQQATILAALDQLRAGGSTAGGAGIELAYQTAQQNFIPGGVNRVILCTDGDFNVGVTSTAELERMAEQKAKDTGVFLTVLGFGRGNLNDAMMEAISGKGNGNYHYVDSLTEARKVLVEEMSGTLVTIAKDVKLQVEFNPAQVAGYRLIGYENRMLRTEDFNDDKKDAGEIGAGHTVTALYEIVPAGKTVDTPGVEPLKYQAPNPPPRSSGEGLGEGSTESPFNNELLTLKIRYKQPDGDASTKLEFPITDAGGSFADATEDFQFAAAVASFGMLLRDSEHRGNATYASVLETSSAAADRDPHGYRAEFLQLVQRAKQLAGE